MAERKLDMGNGLALWEFDVDELREQDVNAHAMPRPMFDRLTETIERDGRLESLPFVALTEHEGETRYEIVSGHHRKRSAKAAGIKRIYGLVDETGLSRAAIAAKQLAHNSIMGMDDPDLVRRIFETIDDVNLQLEAFVDLDALQESFASLPVPNLDIGVEYKSVMIAFLPIDREAFDRAAALVAATLPDDAKALYAAELTQLEQLRMIVSRVGREFEIKNFGVILGRMAELVSEALGAEGGARPDEWVAVRDLLGVGYVPAEAALVIREAMAKAETRGVVGGKNAWQAVELWAADYLASA